MQYIYSVYIKYTFYDMQSVCVLSLIHGHKEMVNPGIHHKLD